MNDLENRLAALADHAGPAPSEATVTAVLHTGRRALRRRRLARGAAGAIATLTVAGAVTWGVTGNQHSARPAAQQRPSATPGTTAPTQLHASDHAGPGRPVIQLVSYHGSQLPGYTVRTVPKGYVLQGISSSVLDIAKAGDTSSLDTFVGKITVMLNEQPGTVGRPVTVKGHPGRLDNQDGVQILTYSDGGHNIAVQAWSDVHVTADQLIKFAEGVTVLPAAEVGHG